MQHSLKSYISTAQGFRLTIRNVNQIIEPDFAEEANVLD